MARPDITPLSTARPFPIDEMFFSATDPKGIIRTGNSVFARVSGYALPELIGQPHNIIRHPDMPRCVFKLLWDYLDAGKPIAAYVKNMARDGAYYWVVATAMPVPGGYLSLRFKPSSELLPVVEGLYTQLRATELACEREANGRKLGMQRSGEQLQEALQGLGFAGYDAFMCAALPLEVKSRQLQLEQMSASRRSDIATAATASHLDRGDLERLARDCEYLQDVLDAEFAQMEAFRELHTKLETQSRFVRGLAHGIRLGAVNALAAAARVGSAGATLGVLAQALAENSEASAALTRTLEHEIDGALSELPGLGFRIAVAKLQVEMTAAFVHELAATTAEIASASSPASEGIISLTTCLSDGAGRMFDAFLHIGTRMEALDVDVDELRRLVRALDVIYMSGKLEASRIESAGAFLDLFEQVGARVAQAREELHAFSAAIASAREEIERTGAAQADAQARLRGMAACTARTHRTTESLAA